MTKEQQARIEWFCDECGGKIEDKDGTVSCSRAEVARRGNADTGIATWLVAHFRCYDDHYNQYEIGVSDLRTRQGVARWSDHLGRKLWMRTHSDWDEIMAAALESGEGGRDRRSGEVFA